MTTCFYCDEGDAEAGAAHKVDMHKNLSAEYGAWEQKYRYISKSFYVPRCSRCRSVHKMRRRIFILITPVTFLIWLYLNIWAVDSNPINGWFWNRFGNYGEGVYLIGLGLLISSGIGLFVEGKYQPAIKSEERSKEYPDIANAILEGYRNGARPHKNE